MDGENLSLVAGGGGTKDSLDMSMVSRTEYGIRVMPGLRGGRQQASLSGGKRLAMFWQ